MSDIERRAILGAAGLVGVAALMKAAHGSVAGPIDPPVGPVAPSGHSLEDVYNKVQTLPNGTGDGRIPIPGGTATVNINNSGSYVLTGNVVVTSATAVNISNSNVTLDLNGYQLAAAIGPGPVVNIIPGTSGIPSNITVRNGSVVGGSTGVGIGNSVGTIIEDLRIVGPRTSGVASTSASARGIIVRRCTFVDIGAGTTATDPALTIIAISLQGNAGSVVTDNTINRLFSNGAGGSTFNGILASGAAAAVYIARNSINCSPAVPSGAATVGISFPATVTGILRDNSVLGFSPAYSPTSGGGSGALMIDGGGNVS